jgi:DNA-directed RNA polymerase subunit RPC12/RpoP
MQYHINPKRVVESVIRYRCPDCGKQAEIPAAPSDSADCDIYQSVLCPSCRQLHCVNAANGEVVAEEELGDPW